MWNDCVSDVPAGLIACRIGGEQMHIHAISPNALWLRLADERRPQGTLELCFRRLDGSRRRIVVNQYQAGEAHRGDCGALIRLSFSDDDFSKEFHRSMTDYARYVAAFEEGDVGALIDYPSHLDAVFTEEESDFQWLNLPDDREICLSLHDPRLYARYIDGGLPAVLEQYPIQMEKISRLYVGNGFCRQLFPDADTLKALLSRSQSDHMPVTLVTAPDPRISEALLTEYQGEMLVNDWGLLHALQKYPRIRPLLGTLINKRRKDPRMRYMPDLSGPLPKENALSDPDYREFLRKLKVERWEFERCGYDFTPPEGRCSLHLPWYQTNTSIYCPLKALCEHGDRAYQRDDDGCPQYCRRNQLLYPRHLKMTGRWNSLFALDDRPLDELSGFDRLVLNL